ncbi:MAG: NAD(P)-dependent glycerol-3-phosphate dehydrogenase [Verrucomicrobia bacterium]|nr:NAD(P)-dependent glycerol-3-phosphate dehydrogenase [Verrucomicrobiota bacterium]
MNISILGKGAWGLAMGELLQTQGHLIEWLDKGSDQVSDGCEVIIVALPTQAVREVLQRVKIKSAKIPVISLSKGIDIETGQRISQIVAASWPEAAFVALSGPSLAGELRKKVPTAMVAASLNDDWAEQVQQLFHGPFLRVYRSRDLSGVEWGGALKNIYALAAGMCAGLGLGENSLAGLVTRSLREMTRIAVHFGAQESTLHGLSGMGDLVLTSYSRASRNRRVGERLGAGDPLKKALASVEGICEGVPSTEALHRILQSQAVEAPVAEELYQILFKGKPPEQALMSLLSRDPKEERE